MPSPSEGKGERAANQVKRTEYAQHVAELDILHMVDGDKKYWSYMCVYMERVCVYIYIFVYCLILVLLQCCGVFLLVCKFYLHIKDFLWIELGPQKKIG